MRILCLAMVYLIIPWQRRCFKEGAVFSFFARLPSKEQNISFSSWFPICSDGPCVLVKLPAKHKLQYMCERSMRHHAG